VENAVTLVTPDLVIQHSCVDSIMNNHWFSTGTVFLSGTAVKWMFMKDVSLLVCITRDLYIELHSQPYWAGGSQAFKELSCGKFARINFTP